MFGRKKKNNTEAEAELSVDVEILDDSVEVDAEQTELSSVPVRPTVAAKPALPSKPKVKKSNKKVFEEDPELQAEIQTDIDIIEEITDESVAEENIDNLTADLEDDITDESVMVETVINEDPELVQEPEDSESEEILSFDVVELPALKKSLVGYNPNEADDFIYTIVERFNLLLEEKNKAEEKVDLLLEARSELLERQQEDSVLIEALKAFNLTDEVKKSLESASHEANNIIDEAKNASQAYEIETQRKAEEILATTEAEKENIVAELVKEAKLARDAALLESKFILDNANEKLQAAEKTIAKELTAAHDEAKTIKKQAEIEAAEILAETKKQAELIVKETNESLTEAREFIARRRESHSRMIDMYKQQAEFLAKEQNNLPE